MNTMLHIPIDTMTKTKAQRVARDVGMPLQRLVRGYLENVANQHVEFPPRRMSKKLERILGQVERDFRAGKNIHGPFKDVKDAINYLNSL